MKAISKPAFSLKNAKKYFSNMHLAQKAALIRKHYGDDALSGGFSITNSVKKYIFYKEKIES